VSLGAAFGVRLGANVIEFRDCFKMSLEAFLGAFRDYFRMSFGGKRDGVLEGRWCCFRYSVFNFLFFCIIYENMR